MDRKTASKIVDDLEDLEELLTEFQGNFERNKKLLPLDDDDYFASARINVLYDRYADVVGSMWLFRKTIQSTIDYFCGLIRHYAEEKND